MVEAEVGVFVRHRLSGDPIGAFLDEGPQFDDTKMLKTLLLNEVAVVEVLIGRDRYLFMDLAVLLQS